VSENHDVSGLDERHLPTEIDESRWSVSGEDRKLHVGRFARRRRAPIQVVRVAVNEPHADASDGVADAGQGAQQQAAVPPDHERTLATNERGGHGLAQRLRGGA
jgi:hypothetical protein